MEAFAGAMMVDDKIPRRMRTEHVNVVIFILFKWCTFDVVEVIFGMRIYIFAVPLGKVWTMEV